MCLVYLSGDVWLWYYYVAVIIFPRHSPNLPCCRPWANIAQTFTDNPKSVSLNKNVAAKFAGQSHENCRRFGRGRTYWQICTTRSFAHTDSNYTICWLHVKHTVGLRWVVQLHSTWDLFGHFSDFSGNPSFPIGNNVNLFVRIVVSTVSFTTDENWRAPRNSQQSQTSPRPCYFTHIF